MMMGGECVGSNVVELKPWEAVKFSWGGAIRHANGDWEKVILNNGQEIDLTNVDVLLHENGIEFV